MIDLHSNIKRAFLDIGEAGIFLFSGCQGRESEADEVEPWQRLTLTSAETIVWTAAP